jgi:hypothetical protein
MGMFDFLTNNKQLPSKWNYQGSRPPAIGDSLRPVQNMVTETLMRRSQGQDVGFDPARRTELGKMYDIDFNRAKEQRNNDFQNRLSGSGQSRNLAAYDALINKGNQWADDTRSKYMMGLDVEDLTRRNEERDVNTQRLQNLNTMNFGQENTRANFDLNEYGQGQQFDLQRAEQYDNPWAAALRTGSNIAGTVAQFIPGTDPQVDWGTTMSKPTSGLYANETSLKGMGNQSGAGNFSADALRKKASPTGSFGNYRLLNA